MNASGMLNTCKSYGKAIFSGERVSNAWEFAFRKRITTGNSC
jgi:hypothetical protein